MATYKVLQDIEAEDKLIGPLTMKQFIFAIIAFVLMFIAFMFARMNIALGVPWLIPIAFFGFMAAPIGRDQPNDVWLAAKIRFLIKPRRRRWDQSGMVELVTITVPKKVEIERTNGLNQTQVQSRLKALASTLDSRGWAIKNVSTNLSLPGYQNDSNVSDRLLELSTVEEVPEIDVKEDVFDPINNMVARRFDTAIKEQQAEHITKLKDMAKNGEVPVVQATPPADYSFITQPPVDPGYTTFGAQVVDPAGTKNAQQDSFLDNPVNASTTDAEIDFLNKLHKRQELDKEIASHGHERVVNPLNNQPPPAVPANSVAQTAPDDILEQLGQSNDLSVASLASLAKHAEDKAAMHNDETVSLH